MDPSNFGAFQQQIKRNQDELTDYLKDLDSWKASISKKDEALKAKKDKQHDNQNDGLPPVRNSLHKKVKRRKKKVNDNTPRSKSERIPGHDFRAWDKYDVESALKDVDGESECSSYEEETDEELEEQKYKQQAVFEKDQGNEFFKKGKYNEAISCYTRGIQCDSTNAAIYANRAMALLKQDKFGAVEKDCTDAIILDPSYVKAYMRRATARKKLGKLESALDDFQQVVKLEPDNKPAQREVAVLEQELKISKEGIVLPIKKSTKERSMKPYYRVEIEELDPFDMQSKMNEAIAQATAQQSGEQQRMVEKDNEMFRKFTENSKATSPVSKTVEPIQCANGLDTDSPDTTKSFQSPADINTKINLTAEAGSKFTSKSPLSSPRTSPRAPANSFQFQRDWRIVRNDMDQIYNYLKMISPSQYPKLFGESMEAGILSQILNVFLHRYLRDGIDISEHLLYLSKVKRFNMTVMLMSTSEKQVSRDILQKLSDTVDSKGDFIAELTKLYQL